MPERCEADGAHPIAKIIVINIENPTSRSGHGVETQRQKGRLIPLLSRWRVKKRGCSPRKCRWMPPVCECVLSVSIDRWAGSVKGAVEIAWGKPNPRAANESISACGWPRRMHPRHLDEWYQVISIRCRVGISRRRMSVQVPSKGNTKAQEHPRSKSLAHRLSTTEIARHQRPVMRSI